MLLKAWRTRLYTSLKSLDLNISIWTILLQFPKDFKATKVQQEFLNILKTGDRTAISKFTKIKSNREQLIYELTACLAIDVLKQFAPLAIMYMVRFGEGRLLDSVVEYAKALDYFKDH